MAGALLTLALLVPIWVVGSDVPSSEQEPLWVWALVAAGAHALGGALAGVMARRSPEVNGALSAALCPVLLVAGYVSFIILYNLVLHGPAGVVPDYLNSPTEIREFVADEEFFGFLVLAGAVVVWATFAVPVGYAAGSLAGRLRSTSYPANNRNN